MTLIEDRKNAAAFFIQHPFSWQMICEHIPTNALEINFDYWLNVYPVLRDGALTMQDPIYHAEGDVWTHTQMVVKEMVVSTYYQQANPHQRCILFLAALLHDIAKPVTTIIDETTGRISHPHHSPIGASMARQLLWQQQAPIEARESICQMIFHHQRPYYLLVQKNPQHILHKLSWELTISDLLALADADTKGRINPDTNSTLHRINKLKKLAKEESCYDKPKYYVDSLARRKYAVDKTTCLLTPSDSPKGPRVYLLSGLPASGKNHWVDQHLPDLPCVSFDDTLQLLHLKYGDNHQMVAELTFRKANEYLKKGASFVWNATNLSKSNRAALLQRCYHYDASITIVYLETDITTLNDRNSARPDATYVPLEGMKKKLKIWDVPKPWEAEEVIYTLHSND